MIDPYTIADWFSEKKKLKEKDDVRSGKIMVISILQKIQQVRCNHKNIDYDLNDGVELLDKDTLSVKIECTDCGKEGHSYWDLNEVEWK